MAGQNPNDVVVPGSIGAVDAEAAPWSWVPPDWLGGDPSDPTLPPIGDQQLTLPGELAKNAGGDPVPPPTPTIPIAGGPAPVPQPAPQPVPITPQPKSTLGPKGQHLATPGAPVGDEVPAYAMAQPLSPAEEAQIEIDPLRLSPEEEAQIQIDQPALPPPFAPDAISGLEKQPAELTKSDDVRSPSDPYTGINSPDAGEAVNAWVNLAETNPDEYIKQIGLAESATRNRKLADDARLAREDAQRENQINAAHMEAIQKSQAQSAQLDADVQELSKRKVDPDRWWNDRSTGQKIAGFVSAIVGGLAQSAGGTGGRNVGLDMINKSIDDDIAAQTTDLQNQRASLGMRQGIVAEMYAKTGDLYAAQETARIASLNQAARELEIKQTQFDPSGTTYRAIGQSIVQARALAAQARSKADAELLDKNTKLAELKLKQLDIFAKQQKLAGAGVTTKFKPEYFSAQGLPPPPFPMSQKEYDQFMGRLKSTKELAKDDTNGGRTPDQARKDKAEADKAESEAAAAKTGYELVNPETGQPFQKKDGTPVIEMDATKRNRAAGIVEAAANVRRLADKMQAILAKGHGTIKALGSDDAQEIQNLTSMIDFETFKAFDLGAPSAGDKALAEGVRGGADPTSFIKNATAGFQAYANSVEQKANAALRSSHYDGPALHFHRSADLPKAKPNVVDELGTKLTTAQFGNPDNTGNPIKDAQAKVANLSLGDMPKDTDEQFQQLAAFAEQPTEMGDQARETLKSIASKAVAPAVRARAQQILSGLPGAQPPATPGGAASEAR